MNVVAGAEGTTRWCGGGGDGTGAALPAIRASSLASLDEDGLELDERCCTIPSSTRPREPPDGSTRGCSTNRRWAAAPPRAEERANETDQNGAAAGSRCLRLLPSSRLLLTPPPRAATARVYRRRGGGPGAAAPPTRGRRIRRRVGIHRILHRRRHLSPLLFLSPLFLFFPRTPTPRRHYAQRNNGNPARLGPPRPIYSSPLRPMGSSCRGGKFLTSAASIGEEGEEWGVGDSNGERCGGESEGRGERGGG
uniref:Uncharacterized protein n=1 Tax=Oryza glumipatula TaxID=40148 RepID=A0A0D9ZD71_9ORYZ